MFLENVKSKMNYSGLTQKELSEKTGISINTIRGWFSKDLIPDVYNAYRIAKVLNTTVEFLVTGETDNQAERDLIELKAKLMEILLHKK